MTLLTVQKLSMQIGTKPILKDISFTVQKGEIFGIIGESGSGKSLTALSILKLLPSRSTLSGTITLERPSLRYSSRELTEANSGDTAQPATNITTATEPEMCQIRGQGIGMVFQEPMTALNPLQTIGQQVAETITIHTSTPKREAHKRAAEILTRVGLPQPQFPLTRFPHELSGGQRQRVVIAMAIALRPQLLIADEPTTALDVTTQAQILDLLKSLVAEFDMGLILITHDLGLVADTADRIAIMRHGEIVESGETKALFRNITHPYTRQLLEASSHQPTRTPAPADLPVLEVKNVIRDYTLPRSSLFGPRKTFRAVDNVSFTIKRGENLGLVGESGCGKSTLTRAILALDAVQSGQITVMGENVTDADGAARATRRRMQVVFQDPYASFNPRQKVGRLITEPFHLLDVQPTRTERNTRIATALSDVGLTPEDADKYIHEFSGGQRQRIAIARALIIEPDLIILDEAVSALDVSIRAQILDLLADLSTRKTLSYLFISHDLSVVRAITDRVLIMQNGKIVEEGPTETIFTTPRETYTKTLIQAAPNLETALTET